jgi:hypothetical protein
MEKARCHVGEGGGGGIKCGCLPLPWPWLWRGREMWWWCACALPRLGVVDRNIIIEFLHQVACQNEMLNHHRPTDLVIHHCIIARRLPESTTAIVYLTYWIVIGG